MPLKFFLASFVVLLASCHPDNRRTQLLAINEELTRSLHFIEDHSDTNSHQLSRFSVKEEEQYWGRRWEPIAIEARHYSNRVNSYIDSLNRELDRTETLPIDLRRALFDTLISYKQRLRALFSPAVTGIDTQDLYEAPYQLWSHLR